MNIPHLPHRRSVRHFVGPSLRFPKIPVRASLSLSTKLILLVVIPLALTLAVTLPLTVTGLNKLASVTSTERLEDEILLVGSHFAIFEEVLNRAADDIAFDPSVLLAVRDSNTAKINAALLSARVRFGLQHAEILDGNGVQMAHQHKAGIHYDRKAMDEIGVLGLSSIATTKLVQAPEGWFLISVRPLQILDEFIGSVSVGKLIDGDALAEMNFNRGDPVLVLLDDEDAVISASYRPDYESTNFPIIPDRASIRLARSGQIAIGLAKVDGEDLPTAYVPVAMGNGPNSVLTVTLTNLPVVGLRDQLIANHVIVTAALSLLVLGVGYTVTRAITRRILRLRDGAVEIGNGNLSFRIEENTHDEMGTLAHEFNRMSDSLKEKNTQLEQANQDLEHRVSVRTEELQQANVQLLEAQSQLVRTEKFGALGELSAVVAHDLRNPLGAIRNGIFFLKSRLAKNEALAKEPKVDEYLQIMDERITQCDQIIEALISLTRISSPNYVVVTLSDVLESTLSSIDVPDGVTVIEKYGLDSMEVQADPLQLLRVFTNLVINAYEAMLEGGELTVAVAAVGSSVEVSIKDTGPGISPEGLEKIFEPLYTTKIQGTGLGLAVCQQVIAKHNGSLEVHSKQGVGTTFTVTLPLISEGQ